MQAAEKTAIAVAMHAMGPDTPARPAAAASTTPITPIADVVETAARDAPATSERVRTPRAVGEQGSALCHSSVASVPEAP